MILEGIVTTLDPEGLLNVAPMGPRIDSGFERFVLRPYRSSTTYRNLKRQGEGVLHVVDDVLLLARATIGSITDAPTRAAELVRGQVLLGCCRYYEFRVTEVDESGERAAFHSETLAWGRIHDVFGFNRARHSVLETAILASRIDFLPAEGLGEELAKHRTIVEKTGDEPEVKAFGLLEDHIRDVARRRGLVLGTSTP